MLFSLTCCDRYILISAAWIDRIDIYLSLILPEAMIFCKLNCCFLGYYADPEAKCQVFHICTADGQGGLAKYSFLCPNGTIFNQNYFICDWWFNFDCSEAEGLYSKNEEIAAEREAASAASASASDSVSSYASPAAAGKAAPAKPAPAAKPAATKAAPKPAAAAKAAPKPAVKAAAPSAIPPPEYDDQLAATDSPASGYGAPNDASLSAYDEEETTLAADLPAYGADAAAADEATAEESSADASYLPPQEERRRKSLGRAGRRLNGGNGSGRQGGRAGARPAQRQQQRPAPQQFRG